MKMARIIRGAGMTLLFLVFLGPGEGRTVENDECLGCHGEAGVTRENSTGMKDELFVEEERFKYSVHHVNGIGCVDCHLDIEELNWDNDLPHAVELSPVDCAMCHPEVGEAYMDSVHQKASSKGITIPCYACHAYHDTQRLAPASVSERQNSFCRKCHEPEKFHDWLPQKEAHFAFVECTVCHAPDTPRHIRLRFFDLIEGKFLDPGVILRNLNTDRDGFMELVDQDANGIIGVQEFEDLLLMMRQRNIRGIFHGELVADMEPTVHQVNRGGASRECEQCHTADSPFFQDVRLNFDSSDGIVFRPEVDRQVLETYHMGFNALGGTRVRLLDKIGIALIVGGVAVVGVHLTARILTVPLRRRGNGKHQ